MARHQTTEHATDIYIFIYYTSSESSQVNTEDCRFSFAGFHCKCLDFLQRISPPKTEHIKNQFACKYKSTSNLFFSKGKILSLGQILQKSKTSSFFPTEVNTAHLELCKVFN